MRNKSPASMVGATFLSGPTFAILGVALTAAYAPVPVSSQWAVYFKIGVSLVGGWIGYMVGVVLSFIYYFLTA